MQSLTRYWFFRPASKVYCLQYGSRWRVRLGYTLPIGVDIADDVVKDISWLPHQGTRLLTHSMGEPEHARITIVYFV